MGGDDKLGCYGRCGIILARLNLAARACGVRWAGVSCAAMPSTLDARWQV